MKRRTILYIIIINGIILIIKFTFDSKIKKIRTGKNIEENEAIIALSDNGPVIVFFLNKKKLQPFQLSK